MGYNLDRSLFEAAARGDMDAVVEFVELGADVNFFDEEGSVLEQACLSKDLEIVEYLVEKNVDLTDEGTGISLIAAAQLKDLDIFNFLIEKGAIIDPKYTVYNVDNILVAAAYGDHWDLVKKCVEKGVDINGKRDDDWAEKRCNALYYAIRKHNLEMIKFLLEHGIDQEGALDTIIRYLFTYTGDTEAIKYYLEKGYSFNIDSIKRFINNTDFDKNNKEHIDILKTLLKRKSCYKELEDILHDKKLYNLVKD